MLAWYWKSTTLQNRSRKSLPSWHWILEYAWAKRITISLYRHYSIYFLDWSNIWIWTGRVGQKLVLVLTDLFSCSRCIIFHFRSKKSSFSFTMKTHVSHKMVIDNKNVSIWSENIIVWMKNVFSQKYYSRSKSGVLNQSKCAVLKSSQ